MIMDWYLQPWFSVACGILLFFVLEWLKKWLWFSDHVLYGQFADQVSVLVLGLPMLVTLLVSGQPLPMALQQYGSQVVAAFGTWAVQHGLTPKPVIKADRSANDG